MAEPGPGFSAYDARLAPASTSAPTGSAWS